jgi:hypothetical protein
MPSGLPRRLLPLVAVGALALAACVPVNQQQPPPPSGSGSGGGGGGGASPPPPQPTAQYCASSVPSSASAYQSAFNNLRKTYTEWASADGAVPVPIDGGRVLWMFGDTYIGKVSSNGSISPPDVLVNNSFVLQTGKCFKPLMGGAPLARTNEIPNPSAGQFYWPASGIMDNGGLQIFMLRVQSAGGSLGFQIKGMEVATFSTSSFAKGSSTAVPWQSTKPFGQANFSDGTHVYLYGSHNEEESNLNPADGPEQRHYVARALVGQVKNIGAWEYWNGTSWTVNNPGAAVPMTFVPGTPAVDGYDLDGPAGGFSVTAAPAGADYAYLGTAKLLDAFSADVSVFTADNPWGPWTYRGKVADTNFPGLSTYSAFTHLALPGTPAPVSAFSTNDQPFDAADQPVTIGVYGPRFVPPLLNLLDLVP